MDLSSKTYDMIGAAAGLGSGILAWMYTSTTNKYAAGSSLKLRFEDALADTLGAQVVNAIDSTYPVTGRAAPSPQPKIWGWINSTTGTGIALALVDYFLGDVINFKPYSRDLDGLRKVVQGVAAGVTTGGVIGGIFDPPAGQTLQGVPGVLGAGTPQPQSYASAVVAHNLMAVQQGGV